MAEKKSLTNYTDLSKNNRLLSSMSFISNDLDSLSHSFLRSFKKSLNTGCLRQYVVTPSDDIKNRLIQHLKNDLGIFFGVRFLSLPQAIEHIMKLMHKKPLNFPHHHQMMIFLYSSIKSLLEEAPGKYPELTQYLLQDDEKCLFLAEHLSHTFLSYGLYGNEALISWLQKDDWQQYLFKKAEKHWDFPHTFLEKADALSIQSHFHLFNLPFIPRIYRSLFDRINTTTYYRSPTPHFTADILPDKALAKIDEQLKHSEIKPSERLLFHNLGKEPNRFFANLANHGNEITEWLYDKEISEEFHPPTGETALAIHQNAIFQLEKAPEIDMTCDPSIQIHSSPTKFREIEVIYDLLLQIFTDDPSIKTEDVHVFAPDIEIYAPAVEFVFDQTDSPFGYFISDISGSSRLSPLSMIQSFFHLAFGRFKPKEIFELINSPYTNNPDNCADDDIKILCSLFDKIHVHWGFDKEMREDILASENVTEKGTFKDGFEKLISSLSYLSSPIEMSQSESLGQLILYLESMANNLRTMKKEKQKIGSWIEQIYLLTKTYFKESETSERFLKEISKLASLTKFSDKEIPCEVILKIIDEITTVKEGKILNSSRPIIHFSSIADAKILSPKVTILLGMDEEAFPRCETKRSLDVLKNKPGSEHRPSTTQKDKLFFFEALAYTKKQLIFSYTHTSDADGKELFPSLLVEDLLSATKGLFVQSHPPSKQAPEKISETLHIESKPETPTFETIEISNLTRLATHPLRFFLQKRCGIFLDREDEEETKEMSEFLLSYQKKAEIRQKAYQNDKVDIIDHIESHGLMPTAIFSIAAKMEVENEINEAKHNLKAFHLSYDDFITIYFDPAIETPIKRSETEYLHPPIQVGKTMLYGQIELVTKNGFFSFGNKSIETIWKAWPKLLLLSLITEWEFPQTILFAKDGQQVDIEIKDPYASLETFLNYYEKAFSHPSPLMPSHIKAYAKNKSAPKSQGVFKDAYLDAVKPNLDIDWSLFIEEVYETI